jgi:hypothetical protein
MSVRDTAAKRAADDKPADDAPAVDQAEQDRRDLAEHREAKADQDRREQEQRERAELAPADAGRSREDHPYVLSTADGKSYTSASLVGTHVAVGDDVVPVVGSYAR